MLTENICLSIEFWMIRKKSLTMGGKLTTSTNRWRLSVNPNVICSSWYLLFAAIIPGFLMFTWSGSFCGRYTGGFSTTLELPIVINASSKHSTVCHGMTLSSFYKFQILNLHITEKIQITNWLVYVNFTTILGNIDKSFILNVLLKVCYMFGLVFFNWMKLIWPPKSQ